MRTAGGGAAPAGNDDGEEQVQDLNSFHDRATSAYSFLDAATSASPSVEFRNVASRARWVEAAGVAEVVESKGNPWLTTGVIRGAKLCCNIEEIGFLVGKRALILLDDKDETIGKEVIYEKIAGGKYGCSWDAFQAYKHLKLLGYIVGRYGVPWTVKNSGTCDITVPPTGVVHNDKTFNRFDGTCSNTTKLLKEMHIDGISPSFEVYLPNSKFKKSSPGVPSFLLCVLRNKPPSRVELETVEYNFGAIPLKYCYVDNGLVTFLSFDKAALPSLP